MVKADFIFSDGEKNTVGKANITKSDTTTVTFTEPQEYSGISIKSDSTGKEDILSFEFSGIPASVPKSIAGDISLMFSLFSDEIPTKIKTLDKEFFRKAVSDKQGYEVFFTENGVSYTIAYDITGTPYSFDAGNDKISVSIILSDFTRT